jgi:hypothetical protein
MKANHPFTFRNTVVFIIVALLVILFFVRYRNIFSSQPKPESTQVLVRGFGKKPAPRETTFHGCPPEGNGGDGELNLLKNRVDEGNYQSVKLEAVLGLRWPRAAERQKRNEWAGETKSEISQNEGVPIAVEGYLLRVKEEGPESPNCRSDDPESRDFHIWLASSPDDDQNNAVVVEITPRIRSTHSMWTLAEVRKIIHDHLHVRISGWLLFDQEHPDQVGKSRGTLWEIHPIMKIEIERGGGWMSIDRAPA